MSLMPSSASRMHGSPDRPGAAEEGDRPTDALAPDQQQMLARLQSLGEGLTRTLKEAVDGRAASGIEHIWVEDEEHFEGIDEKNRGLVNSYNSSKPPGQLPAAATQHESTEFPNITRPYVEAAAAKLQDILQPTDGALSWKLTSTPIPDLIEKAKGGLDPEVIEGLASINASEDTALKVLQAEQAHAQALVAEADDKAKRAAKRIEDWQVEGNYNAALREVIDDAVRCGTGVLKGPVPEMKRRQMFKEGQLVMELVMQPGSKRVDYWNCFPDPAAGQNPHNGRYHWERDYLTEVQLGKLKEDPDYIGQHIDFAIDEGPASKTETRKQADGRVLEDKDVFEVWYYYGFATREDLACAGVDVPAEMGSVHIPAQFTIVNGRVIKGALSELDTGEFPYDYFRWQRRKNSPWGVGVARQIRTPQRIVVAATRVMLTNAGRAAGPLLVLRNGVRKSDGTTDITPWAVYYVPADTVDGGDSQKAAQLVQIPALTNELMAIIQYGQQMAEKVTSLPLLLQGQQGDSPDTYGGQQLVDRNASGVLRRIARNFDDDITEPHLRRYYAYLLMYGEDDMEKGEFVLDAKGSTALVDRELLKQETQAYLQASLNPKFGIDPKKAMEQSLRANNRNPKDWQYTEEQQEQMDKAASQPPSDPKAQATIQAAQIRDKGESDRETNRLRAEALEAAKQRQHEMQLADKKLQEALIGYAAQEKLQLTDVKADLSELVLKLRTQTALSSSDKAHERAMKIMTPPTEPAGKAPPGEAFQK
jgi:hypothetical protein